MMNPRIAELLGFLDAERAHLMSATSALPQSRWTERPSPERWSVTEVLWHLQVIETNIAGLIAKRSAKARAENHPAESESTSVLGAMDGIDVLNRERRLTAPASITPTEAPSADAALAMLGASREAMRKALADADGLALATIKHTHPVFGELDLYQWVLFVGGHERRHASQITEIIGQLQ